jgi:hypothetical protein
MLILCCKKEGMIPYQFCNLLYNLLYHLVHIGDFCHPGSLRKISQFVLYWRNIQIEFVIWEGMWP